MRLSSRWGYEEVLRLLQSGVFHVTTLQGYVSIRKDGLIRSRVGSPVYPNAGNSFARTNGYVAMFDFRSTTQAQLDVIDDGGTWTSYFPPHGSRLAIALEINVDKLGSDYLPHSARKETNRLAIPFVECWSKADIPLNHVTSFFIYSEGLQPISLPASTENFEELDQIVGEILTSLPGVVA